MVQIKQNLGICIGLSALGGILEVFATAILAYPDAQAKEGNHWTARTLRCCLLANVVLQVLASIIGNLFAPWFGPVSIVGPTFLSAQLVGNMIIYGSLLGLECFTKDMRIGTAVIVTAAILLPVVGPGVLEYENVRDLLQTWYSIVLNIFLIAAMVITAILLVLKVLKRIQLMETSKTLLYATLLTARATSFTINLSYSKVFVLDPSTTGLIVSIILKILSGAVMTGAIVVQSTSVKQNTFVPLNATCIITVNAIAGIILWEDWRVVESWLGYATVFIQLIIGNYLLLGEIDLFGPGNKRYGRMLLLRRFAGRRDLRVDSALESTQKEEEEDGAMPTGEHELPVLTDSGVVAQEWMRNGTPSELFGPVAGAGLSTLSFGVGEQPAPSSRLRMGEARDTASDSGIPSSSGDLTIDTGVPGFPPALPVPVPVSTSQRPLLRAQTTGGLPSTLPPLPPPMQRRYSTGTRADRRAQRRRRSEARKHAWGEVLGVDAGWLERRASHRQMERIFEHDEEVP